MRTSNLRINQLLPETYQWYLDYLKVLDSKDIEAYSAFLAEDCVMQSNNNPLVEGKGAIVQFLSEYWKSFASLEHDLLNIYGSDSAFVLEALNHYKRHDGKPVTLRAVAFTDRNPNGLVDSVRIYTDVTPLFESLVNTDYDA
jgi:ketosteroid isomerase-like protein